MNPSPARELNPGFSKSVERIMMKLLAKDRSSRYQSASEVLDALKQVALKPSRGGWFSKTPPTSDPALPSPLVSRASESGLEAHLPGPDAGPRKSSSEVTVVRPVRRDSLPPVTLPPAVAHWIQPPLPSLDINVASPSPPGVPASSTGLPSKPPRRQPDFSYAVEEDTAVQEEAGSDSPLQSAPGHRVRWLLWTFFAAVLLVVGIIYWKFGNPMPVRPHH